ncbi:pyruvate formate-lyase PFL [Rhodomicrobium vannielii ATCC 17100]|uniref:Pyruvate formate-lyase PFL n=1 Tax=Rhodomicrobium vannielii (strain ATCC 17100 / DSM 162 / LMG 4299 / NCIMB 10020 / ATH 3.1.1) TaxID=648757 RepID=E3I4V0_RHOVT|nr:pyruvate formate lyase family protein [Rhodomicrobium vannielii]ADP72772.1 pyruvate formate-lyase PFL [Rhodomicrobium vannielii ATCC 17100]
MSVPNALPAEALLAPSIPGLSPFREKGKLTNAAQSARCSEAASRAKEFLLDAPQKIDTERLTHLLDVYREYAQEPVIVLRARVFERVLQKKTLYIDDNPLVGTVTSKPAGVYPYPEWGAEWILREADQPMVSHLGEVELSDEERATLIETAKYFQTRSAEARARELSRELHGFDPRDSVAAGLITETAPYTIGSGTLDYATFIRRGLGDIIRETEGRLKALPLTQENASKIDFYRAVLISLNALIHLAHRYADLAEKLAAETGDAVRRAELLEIAEVCRHVPENPPRNFREAIQFWWFLHLGNQIEQSGCGSSPGRIGQYLDPWFQADKAQNGFTREDAQAWFKCLFVKILEYGYYQGLISARTNSGHTGHTINLGGLNAAGQDATTELDSVLLDTQIELQNIQPTITILYHDGLQEDFLLKAIELERTGLGQPQWMNTRLIIERTLARHAKNGITIEDARASINMSCVGTGVEGRTAFIHEGGTFNLAKCIELALHDGIDPGTGFFVGARTGDARSFKSFEDFYGAWLRQVEHLFKVQRAFGSVSTKALGETIAPAFRSALYGGCLERGKHVFDGGVDYYLYFVISNAGVDAANSLAAIKHLVFDTGRLTLGELLDAVDANFEGHDRIRTLCLNAPKHGNGDPAIDALVRRVYDDAFKTFHAAGYSYFGDHIANIEAYSLSIHNYYGLKTGALPSGRQKGRPLTDGSVSATPGTDKKGPLALIQSAAQAVDAVKYGSNHFNMKFHPTALAGIGGARKLLSLIKTYMDAGGSHIQFNVVTSDTLRKAQANPDAYKGLTVRVAGFSAYFTRLHKGVQDEIIERTELTFDC